MADISITEALYPESVVVELRVRIAQLQSQVSGYQSWEKECGNTSQGCCEQKRRIAQLQAQVSGQVHVIGEYADKIKSLTAENQGLRADGERVAAAVDALIAEWDMDEIGQIDGQFIADLRSAVDAARGAKP
jgi:hypothetical protein